MLAAKPTASKRTLSACVLAAFLAFGAPAALAQGGSSEFSEEQLQSFARASLEVERLNQAWMPRLQGAKTQEESEALRTTAVAEMAEAIESEGIEVTTYGDILDAARGDPLLAEQIAEFRREAQR